MKLTWLERPRYLALYLLPALALALVVAAAHFFSYGLLKDDLHASTAQVRAEFDHISETARFGAELRRAEDSFRHALQAGLEGALSGAALAEMQRDAAVDLDRKSVV